MSTSAPPPKSADESSGDSIQAGKSVRNRFFWAGAIFSVAVFGVIIWAFSLGVLTEDRRLILRVVVSILTGFMSGAFVGSATIESKGWIPGTVATLTGGFGAWFLSVFFIFPNMEAQQSWALAGTVYRSRQVVEEARIRLLEVDIAEREFEIKPRHIGRFQFAGVPKQNEYKLEITIKGFRPIIRTFRPLTSRGVEIDDGELIPSDDHGQAEPDFGVNVSPAIRRASIRSRLRGLIESEPSKQALAPAHVNWARRAAEFLESQEYYTQSETLREKLVLLEHRLARWGGACDRNETAKATLHPRCRVYPSDLFRECYKHRNDIVFGSMLHDFTQGPSELAMQLAAEEANAQGGVMGRRVGLVMCSLNQESGIDALDEEEATAVLSKYLSEKLNVVAILGPSSSKRVERAYLELLNTDVPIISPGATAVSLRQLDEVEQPDRGMFWRTIPSDAAQVQPLVSLCGAHSSSAAVAIVHQEGTYGTGLRRAVESALVKRGHEVLGFSFKGAFERTRKLRAATRWLQQFPKGVMMVFTSNTEDYRAAIFDEDIRKSMFLLLFPDSGAEESIYLGLGIGEPVLARLRGTKPRVRKSSVYQRFVVRFQNRFNSLRPKPRVTDNVYVPFAYDAAWLGIYGTAWSLKAAGVPFGPYLSRGILLSSCINCPDEVGVGPRDWIKAQKIINGRDGINLTGITGALDYDPSSHELSEDVDVWSVKFHSDSWVVETL